MVEHGKCASGSSKGRGGAYAIVLDAIGFLQKIRTAFSADYRSAPIGLLVSNRRTFNSGRVPLGIQIPRAVTSTPTVERRLPGRSHPPPDLRRIPLRAPVVPRGYNTASFDIAIFTFLLST